jgi:hypothetical protein
VTAKERLLKAAALIERDGWWDGKGNPGPTHCAVTALRDIGFSEVAYLELKTFLGIVGEELADWNDSQPDGAHVIAAMRACAEGL